MIRSLLRPLAALTAATAALAQFPANVTDLKTIEVQEGRAVRFKNPELCETTEGVNSYSGFVDIAEDRHLFFWFFETRGDKDNDPTTLWLNGGPGADSMGGLFDEIGPCKITDELDTELNPHSWNEVSNLVFFSQPVGIGFSYESTLEVSEFPIDPTTGETAPARLSVADYQAINTTELAAEDMWQAMRTLFEALPEMAPDVKSKTLHMATQSYGGHWGPAMFNRFRKETEAMDKKPFDIGSLMIVNGITDALVQYPSYPLFAAHNTHGVHPDPMITMYMETSLVLEASGCLALLELCYARWEASGDLAASTLSAGQACNDAAAMCRQTIDFPFVNYAQTHNYDVRAAPPGVEREGAEPLPPGLYQPYLNQAHIAQALGVETNYTFASSNAGGEVYAAFSHTGDFVRSYRKDLEELLDAGVPVSLFYGDADWVCNWFGGEMLSLATNYTGTEQFAAAGYESLMVDGQHRGDVRQHGTFSFTRVFDSGHAMPFYQPEAAYALFERTIKGMDLASGEKEVTEDYSTSGPANSTYSQVGAKKRDFHSAKFRF